MNPILFSIGSINIYWYSLLILIGAFLGIYLFCKEGKKFNYDKDFLFDLAFYSIIIGFIGARLYYVTFNFSHFENDILSIFRIWEGGLAIHGGIIFGGITAFIYTKKHNVNFIKIIDMLVPSLILAQGIGRWGNFFNSEAHGSITTLATLESYKIPEFVIDGMLINGNYYQPTFFYESVWCIIGFIILMIMRKFKNLKLGQMTGFYLIFYAIGRFLIEALRTDSLMFYGFKVAQLVSLGMILIGIILIITSSRKSKYENLYNSEEGVLKI